MHSLWIGGVSVLLGGLLTAVAQPYGEADRGQAGDSAIQALLGGEAERMDGAFLEGVTDAEEWERLRPRFKEEYLHMLGLWPLPPRTPLQATVTGTLEGDGFVVELLHYQSRPGLYVTANLYRPSSAGSDERLPAVLYVCGHSGRGRDGNKTAFQSHGMWFARHGYVCLVVDTLQLGEIAALHHGTYREGRWWWHSRGYTPAGVECWNGVRGIDYLIGRPDVDAERIAVTGISGGGAATFWVAAADERVKVAVPVSGMADLVSYVPSRVINGHCDCMFLYNTFQWPWTRIAGLVAPRPLLFVNSDADSIFPMDANERIIHRLERLYSLFGASDQVDSVVSVGGHAYREDIRRSVYRFINTHLKNDPRPITDSEIDLVQKVGNGWQHPIAPERLRVFQQESDIPADQLNTTIDEHFVPAARVALPGTFSSWKEGLMRELRRASFAVLPERVPIPAAREMEGRTGVVLETETGIRVRLRRGDGGRGQPGRIVLVVTEPGVEEGAAAWLAQVREPGDRVWWCDARGVRGSRWTTRNPPNYVERSHVLLGRTVDTGRVWDVAAAARYLRAEAGGGGGVHVVGRGGAGLVGAMAALWESDIESVTLVEPPAGHMTAGAPQFLNVLRVCDVADYLGMLAPRRLTVRGSTRLDLERVGAIYDAAGARENLVRLK